MTLHRWAGIGLGKRPASALAKFILECFPLKRKWQTVDILIIDEISMISDDLFQKIDAIGRAVRSEWDPTSASLPFGGIQVIVTGDFMQLAPVSGRFAFRAPAWKKAIEHHVVLDRNFRAGGDETFRKILRGARFGRVSDRAFELLESRLVANCGPPPEDPVPPTTLVPYRRAAQEINNTRLAALDGEVRTFRATWVKGAKVSARKGESYREYMEKQAIAPAIHLKVGAKVICRINSPDVGIYNGTGGVVVAFTPTSGFPVVEFENGIRHTMGVHDWDAPEDAGVYSQIPLILAWALTIHKAQGCQLRRVLIDASDRIFAPGQAYVALSRACALSGVWFSSLSRAAFTAHPEAIEFYVQLHRASK
jgi:ATP-dependent DNA helicase PIF1